MAREFAKQFYGSKRWQRCREAYIAHRRSIDGGMCESCREVPGYIVHHKTELTPDNINDPDITLGHWNLKYDCKLCHEKEHERSAKKIPGMIKYHFDERGDITILPPHKAGR